MVCRFHPSGASMIHPWDPRNFTQNCLETSTHTSLRVDHCVRDPVRDVEAQDSGPKPAPSSAGRTAPPMRLELSPLGAHCVSLKRVRRRRTLSASQGGKE